MGQFELKNRISWHVIFLLMCLSGINFLNMPVFRIIGDPVAIEIASIHLINSGRLSVPKEIASSFGERGQYFYENPRNGRWYSKYGLANTFIVAIPLYIEKLITGNLQYESNSRVLFLNFFNIILTAVLIFYVFQLSALYTNRLWIKVVFCIIVFYCTYLSYYIRAQSSELYQTLFFTGFVYHSIMMIRSNRYPVPGFRGLKLDLHQILLLIFLGLCCLIKLLYILLIPGFLFFVLRRDIKNLHNVKNRSIKGLISANLIPLIFITFLGLFIGIMNYYKFGSIFETGYGQWENEHAFSLGNILPHLLSSLTHPQNSIILNFPILLFSLFGLRTFYNMHREDLSFIIFTILPVYILILSFDNWPGEWTYGPRYFLFSLPVMALPVIPFIEKVFQLGQRTIKYLFSIIMCLVFFISAFLNFNVNSLEFFFPYRIQAAIINDIQWAHIKEYFTNVHFGVIAYDLIRFRDDTKKLHFLAAFDNVMTPLEIKRIELQILERLDSNYYWFARKEIY